MTKTEIAEAFMDIMREYMKRQDEDPNFDGHHELYDLYLRRTHGFEDYQVDEVVDRLEEQVAEHIIEIHEEQNA
jgi:hypothetical protein